MLIGIVGAGAMGGGIARAAAQSGAKVLLYDVRPGAACKALESINAGLTRQVRKGRLSEADSAAVEVNIRTVTYLGALAPADLVIEAVVENLEIKHQVFNDLESIVSTDCVLASNTSSLSIGSIFRTIKTPERALGLHFFNPAHVMKLVEIVPGPFTNDKTKQTAHTFVDQLGKTGIEAQDSPGFVVNLAGRAYATEALALVQDGVATPAQIDRIMTGALKFPLGPFELMDLTGLDVNYPVTQNIHEHNFADPMLRSTWQHRHLYESGLLGQKTAKGFYDYPDGARAASRPDPGRQQMAEGRKPPHVVVLDADSAVEDFCRRMGLPFTNDDDGRSPILCAPVGGDCTDYAVTTLAAQANAASHASAPSPADAARVLAVDLAFGDIDVVTLMAPPGADAGAIEEVATWVERTVSVEIIRDSAGFVAQRIIAAVVNLGCEMAQRGVAAPRDIDTAVELGLRYPAGPLAFADRYSPELMQTILANLHRILQDDRYRTSQWLRRRALTGVDIYQPDFALCTR